MRISRKCELVCHGGWHSARGYCLTYAGYLTLDGLEALLAEKFPRRQEKGLWIHPKVHLVRYADDFIITGNSHELLVTEVRPLVEEFLRERGLELSAEKTHVTRIQDGFDFLGQHLP